MCYAKKKKQGAHEKECRCFVFYFSEKGKGGDSL